LSKNEKQSTYKICPKFIGQNTISQTGEPGAVDQKFSGLYTCNKDFQKKRGLKFNGSRFNNFPVK
jgi:hypothetical protein